MSKADVAQDWASHVNKLVGKSEPKPKYTVIWGNLFRTYTGTTACTGLHTVSVKTKKEATRRAKAILEEVSDLVIMIHLPSGQQVNW